jgi:hypothetical protein
VEEQKIKEEVEEKVKEEKVKEEKVKEEKVKEEKVKEIDKITEFNISPISIQQKLYHGALSEAPGADEAPEGSTESTDLPKNTDSQPGSGEPALPTTDRTSEQTRSILDNPRAESSDRESSPTFTIPVLLERKESTTNDVRTNLGLSANRIRATNTAGSSSKGPDPTR